MNDLPSDRGGAPDLNVTAFCFIYSIETVLRELLVQLLEPVGGARWYKARLPGDVLAKYRDAIAHERRTPWRRMVPHHPLYYLDFPDLRKIIERDDNWHDAFEPIFLRRDAIASTLSELEPIRNAIAHNRRVTGVDVATLESSYRKIVVALGEARVSKLLARSSASPDIEKHFLEVQRECNAALATCLALDELSPCPFWDRMSTTWWFDSIYLGLEVDPIVSFFSTLSEYRALPRVRGAGHRLETWLASADLPTRHAAAMAVIAALLQSQ